MNKQLLAALLGLVAAFADDGRIDKSEAEDLAIGAVDALAEAVDVDVRINRKMLSKLVTEIIELFERDPEKIRARAARLTAKAEHAKPAKARRLHQRAGRKTSRAARIEAKG
ncbi:MAG: hypothetical protein GY788_21170 [bacterium]|nr:hypothetical protein [bacterium]